MQSRIVVKFYDWVKLPYESGAEKLLAEQDLAPVDELMERFGRFELQPLFTEQKPDRLRELVTRARRSDPGYEPANFLSFFAVEMDEPRHVDELAKALSALRAVEYAYVEGGPVEPPLVNATDDPRSINQGYLDPAPDGIDAEYAWTIAGGAGAGQALVDLEWGWNLNHEDLAAHGASLISGLNHSFFSHGTSVLGEIAAVDNTVGCVGIVPEITSVRVVGQWRVGGGYSTYDAIIDAVATMSFGDVLLLEAQTTYNGFVKVPVEAEPAVFEVIRLATALGIVVVEAAGNGAVDLDTLTDTMGRQVLNRTSADFRDSGAIVVGAATSTTSHAPMGFSCRGSRVDCYGWGENVNTAATDSTGTDNDDYTSFFNGTSSASPIVAGAALAVQGMAEVAFGFRFSPRQMRALLSDPATGTASANPAADRIGVMPDLRAIATSVLNLVPDLYLRDFVGDVGDPHGGAISASPDLILRPVMVANPQSSFGERSGTENDATLGFEAEAGQDNFIYARARNRGGAAATAASVQVFWSPPSTLVTPDLWTAIGDVALPSVPTVSVCGPVPRGGLTCA